MAAKIFPAIMCYQITYSTRYYDGIGCVTRNKVFGPTLVVFVSAELLLSLSCDFTRQNRRQALKNGKNVGTTDTCIPAMVFEFLFLTRNFWRAYVRGRAYFRGC